MTDLLHIIEEYIHAIKTDRLDYDFVHRYNDINKEIMKSSTPSEEMKLFLSAHTISEALRHQIHVDIFRFNEKLRRSEKYNFFAEYMRILDSIKSLKNPSPEMLNFTSESTKIKIKESLKLPGTRLTQEQTKREVEEFYRKLKIASCEYNFERHFFRLCRIINQLNYTDTKLMEFKQLDIDKIVRLQNVKNSIPRRFSSEMYTPKKFWETQAANLGFSKKLLKYKDYATNPNNMENKQAFEELNEIIFEKLTEIIQRLRMAYGSDTNIILCACPSSKPEKINTMRLSIAEYVKLNQSTKDCSDLLLRTQQIEPAHLSAERNIEKHRKTIALNTNKYTSEFFDNKNIYIICDDIYTTGNTVNACKECLMPKQALDNSIFIYTIAQTQYYSLFQTDVAMGANNGY